MRHLTTLFTAFCLCVGVGYYLTQPANLNGHWHLTPVGEYSGLEPGDYFIVDIEDDSVAYWGDKGYGPFRETTVDHQDEIMDFGGECWGIVLGYKYRFGKLYFNELHYSDDQDELTFIGVRCDEDCCDKETEFFKDSKISVRLPIKHGPREALSLDDIERSLTRAMTIGPPKPQYNSCYSEPSPILLGDKFMGSPDDLSLFREHHRVKLPEAKRDQVIILLYANIETPKLEVLTLVKQSRAIGDEPIYLAVNANPDSFSPEFQRIPEDLAAADQFLSNYFP